MTDHNLKDYQILINVFEKKTTGYQTANQVPTSANVCFCATWGKRNT